VVCLSTTFSNVKLKKSNTVETTAIIIDDFFCFFENIFIILSCLYELLTAMKIFSGFGIAVFFCKYKKNMKKFYLFSFVQTSMLFMLGRKIGLQDFEFFIFVLFCSVVLNSLYCECKD